MTDPQKRESRSRSSDAPTPRLSAAVMFCENCGAETAHRILRVDRRSGSGGGAVRGVARCRECRWTHPFESVPPERVTMALILSEGGASQRSSIELAPRLRLEVGSALPGATGPIRIQRLDAKDGRSVSSATADAVATIWAVKDVGATVRVSIVEGRRTRPARLIVPRETRFTVGDRVVIEGVRLEIAALRARGRTWRHPGDSFVAGELQRVYGHPPLLEGGVRSPPRMQRVRDDVR